ncbi:MAG TPA: hypothetical protein VG674_20130 [Amycolatopsis sp.]|jgi:hypothetical protein|nr:hypothetical protein [Amycolatopsis sp.]
MDAREHALTVAVAAILAVGAGSSVALARTSPLSGGEVIADPGQAVTLVAGQTARLSTKDFTVRCVHLAGDPSGAVTVQLSEPGRGERTTSVLRTTGSTTYGGETVELLGVSGGRITVRLG